jgi:hypothetical protein
MTNTIKINAPFLVLLALTSSCKSDENNIVNNKLKSVQLFNQGGDLMIKGYQAQVSSSDSSKILYEQSLQIFLEAYTYDTSNLDLLIYLPDIYARLGKYDSADYWRKKLPVDSIALRNINRPTTLPDSVARK